MDRREALKKIGIGGATVATASVIVSSPAFAYDAPMPPASPVVTAFRDGFLDRRLNVNVSPGAATCNPSATGGNSVLRVGHTSSASPGSVDVSPTSASAAGGPTLTVQFARTALDAATATINYAARYQCQYATGTGVTCRSWTISFTGAFSTVWNTTPTISAPGTSCPTG